ncbi:MAG: chemotaxis protein methyltransferase [Hyphomicrobiales bacterium]|nr:chemotaxis protein methyltransferase [Hyphomicrobiales bacterium]
MSETREPDAEEFKRLCEFIYRRTGMVFGESKRYFVERRLLDRMASVGTGSFGAYFAHLRLDTDGEIEQFVNALTVNETYFFREDHQLRCLTSDILAERVKARRGAGPIRIWSAPCSTGEEPYSIAMWMLEHWPEVDAWEIEIVGSDIDTKALEAARLGVYGRRALMRLPPEIIAKYFVEEAEGRWRILEDLRESVRFTAANIVESSQTRPHGRFDVVFCRNMLIYFDDASRREAAENLFDALEPGGFICLGHSESMSRISPLFEVRRFPDAIVYQKPQEASHA